MDYLIKMRQNDRYCPKEKKNMNPCLANDVACSQMLIDDIKEMWDLNVVRALSFFRLGNISYKRYLTIFDIFV